MGGRIWHFYEIASFRGLFYGGGRKLHASIIIVQVCTTNSKIRIKIYIINEIIIIDILVFSFLY